LLVLPGLHKKKPTCLPFYFGLKDRAQNINSKPGGGGYLVEESKAPPPFSYYLPPAFKYKGQGDFFLGLFHGRGFKIQSKVRV